MFWTAAKLTLGGGIGTGSHSSSSLSALPRIVGELRPSCVQERGEREDAGARVIGPELVRHPAVDRLGLDRDLVERAEIAVEKGLPSREYVAVVAAVHDEQVD
ncbi:MAG: hypothetical protein JF593_13640 [Novosphingobium sp.]|nr:hypothetical protein [Novosphingobium sp.]